MVFGSFKSDIVVDDIVASGATMNRELAKTRERVLFITLYKQDEIEGAWFVFPWEA